MSLQSHREYRKDQKFLKKVTLETLELVHRFVEKCESAGINTETTLRKVLAID